MTSPTHRTTDILRWVALFGTLASIATLEYLAGQAAGWGAFRSAGVPLGIDAFVMAVLLAPRSSGFDRLAALALMEFTVVVSAVAGDHAQTVDGKPANVALGAILATALVFALWRLDETIRADKRHDDQLADALSRLATAERQAADLRERLARVPSQATAVVAEVQPGPVKRGGAKPAAKGAPSREEARAILMGSEDFEAVTNTKLAADHGGTPEFWGQRKKALRSELAELTTEANAL